MGINFHILAVICMHSAQYDNVSTIMAAYWVSGHKDISRTVAVSMWIDVAANTIANE
jgi:hypothetical protein